MDELLAKSRVPGREPVALEQHTRDVLAAGAALLGTAEQPTRLGVCWLRFFRLTAAQKPVFFGSLTAACGLHDWGKANDGFQNAVQRRGEQAIRHEHLSALLVAQPAVWEWLNRPTLDREVILSAVLTHHLKAGENVNRPYCFAERRTGGPNTFRSYHDQPAFQSVAVVTAESLRLTPPDLAAVPVEWDFGPRFGRRRDEAMSRLRRFGDALHPDIGGDAPRRRLLMAVRSALIAADLAGSGLRGEDRPIRDWIADTLGELQPLTRELVNDTVIRGRVEQQTVAGRWRDLGDGKGGWDDFQLACDLLPDRALLLAPCGSGKTLAAWRWIAARLGERPATRVLFLYPTRATATEGFRDYVSWAPEGDATLLHGTSGFDLNGMFDNPEDHDPRQDTCYRLPESDERLSGLAYWGGRAFSATVDQFLAFLQYGRKSVCLLPVLADAVVVIDEVHSFDNSMFAALKGFLRAFDVPVLCMTATLGDNRRRELTDPVESDGQGGCGLAQYPAGEFPPGLQASAILPRYRLRRVADADAAERQVRAALAAGKRVLWVVNQVRRAQDVVRRFRAVQGADRELYATVEGCPDPVPVVCYHSRFRLFDRRERHRLTMRRLKDEPGPALGVTTQVC